MDTGIFNPPKKKEFQVFGVCSSFFFFFFLNELVIRELDVQRKMYSRIFKIILSTTESDLDQFLNKVLLCITSIRA